MFSTVAVTHLRYHQWATNRVLDETVALPAPDLVKTLGGSFPSVYLTLVHLYQADSVWLDRLKGLPTGALDKYQATGCMYDMQDAWSKVLSEMLAWAEEIRESEWRRQMSYKTQAGVPYQNPLWQVVLHIVNHGAYHRGQVTNMLRQLGLKPVNLDLINFYRANPSDAPEPPDAESERAWLDLRQIATVEATSEDPSFPVESLLATSGGWGWRASQKGEQRVRIRFDKPMPLHHIHLRFQESEVERTQEFTIRWSPAAGGPAREIVRQQWNFSPAGSTTEIEDYTLNLEAVSVLELAIQPDLGRREAVASLAVLRLR